MKLRNVLLAATVLAAPFAVHAQPVDGLYIGAGAGANVMQTERVKHTSNGPADYGHGSDYKFNAGPAVVGSVGYGLGNGLRFELQGLGTDNKINKLKNGGAGGLITSAGGDEYKAGVFANVLYDIPLNSFGLNSPVFPYVGGGVGYVHNYMSNLHIATGGAQFLRSTGQNDNLAAQGIVGLSFPVYSLVPGLSFTAEYRFMSEIGGSSIKEQYFAPRVAVGTKQKFATDDFNHMALIGVRYAFGVAPAAPPPAPAPVPAPTTAARTYLVFFDWDRADLTDRARQIVSEAAQASTRVQYTRIEVQGNADRSGTPAYNQRLSLRRAQTVAAELVRDGVPRTAIDIQAFGDTRPLVPTAAGVREPQNRRVAIILR
jgi:outer membrane protein OmpA-like peptidoglycan-associated protein